MSQTEQSCRPPVETDKMQLYQRITHLLIGGVLPFCILTALILAHNDRLVSGDFLKACLLCELVS